MEHSALRSLITIMTVQIIANKIRMNGTSVQSKPWELAAFPLNG